MSGTYDPDSMETWDGRRSGVEMARDAVEINDPLTFFADKAFEQGIKDPEAASNFAVAATEQYHRSYELYDEWEAMSVDHSPAVPKG